MVRIFPRGASNMTSHAMRNTRSMVSSHPDTAGHSTRTQSSTDLELYAGGSQSNSVALKTKGTTSLHSTK